MNGCYYQLIQNSYHKDVCSLIPVPELVHSYYVHGKEADMSFLNDIILRYPCDKQVDIPLHIYSCVGLPFVNVISDALYSTLRKYTEYQNNIEFIPVSLRISDNRTQLFYFMHFVRFEEAIDYQHSKIIPSTYEGGKSTVAVPVLKETVIKNMNLFAIDSVCGIIVSNELKSAIIKNGFGESLMFKKVKLNKGY